MRWDERKSGKGDKINSTGTASYCHFCTVAMGTVFRKLSVQSTQCKVFGAEMTSQFEPTGLIDLFPTRVSPPPLNPSQNCWLLN